MCELNDCAGSTCSSWDHPIAAAAEHYLEDDDTHQLRQEVYLVLGLIGHWLANHLDRSVGQMRPTSANPGSAQKVNAPAASSMPPGGALGRKKQPCQPWSWRTR
jgi:hypothetical protein